LKIYLAFLSKFHSKARFEVINKERFSKKKVYLQRCSEKILLKSKESIVQSNFAKPLHF